MRAVRPHSFGCVLDVHGRQDGAFDQERKDLVYARGAVKKIAEEPENAALVDGQPAIALDVVKAQGENTIAVVDGVRRVMESYVLDRTDLDLYDERVAVDFVGHVRPTLRFESIDELLVAMARDVERTRDLLER